MAQNEIITKIKSKGYWEINIRPDIYNSRRIEKIKIKDLVRSAVVELRGWDYPHFRDSNGDPYPILNGIEQKSDWENHIEFWRMTQSANFYHLLALREDWMNNLRYENIWSRGDELKGKKLLGTLSTLYTFVEIFEFSKRLAIQSAFNDNVKIEIKLHDLKERHLFVDSSNRVPFSFPRVARIDEPWSNPNQTVSVNELLGEKKVEELALNSFLDLVYLFGWDNPPVENLKGDIQKFLEGRI